LIVNSKSGQDLLLVVALYIVIGQQIVTPVV